MDTKLASPHSSTIKISSHRAAGVEKLTEPTADNTANLPATLGKSHQAGPSVVQIVPKLVRLLKSMVVTFVQKQKANLAARKEKRAEAAHLRAQQNTKKMYADMITPNNSLAKMFLDLNFSKLPETIQKEPFTFAAGNSITNQLEKDKDRNAYISRKKNISADQMSAELLDITGSEDDALALSTLLGQDIPNLMSAEIHKLLGFGVALAPRSHKTNYTTISIEPDARGFTITYRLSGNIKAFTSPGMNVFPTDQAESSLALEIATFVSREALAAARIDRESNTITAPVISPPKINERFMEFTRLADA